MPETGNTPPAPGEPKPPSFWDSWTFFAIFVGILVLVRFFVFEPFKIPSGSMEPTLIGHEDYGDRIVTNRLAYAPLWQCMAIVGGIVVLIVAAYVGAKGWRKVRLSVIAGLLVLGTAGGFLAAWNRGALAGEPKRFDVVVFAYEPKWSGGSGSPKNYIKRLVGLPGDTLVISGGDVFLRDSVTRKDEIIRKWEYDPELQANLWQPVARCGFREKPVPDLAPDADAFEKMKRDAVLSENAAALPWNIEGGKAQRVHDEVNKLWVLDIEGPCELAYAHPVSNVYCKMGRWPFKHLDCQMSKLSQEKDGVVFRDPRARTPNIRPYIPNSWSGVKCPHCGQVQFPLVRNAGSAGARIEPDFSWGKPSDGKSSSVEGDLKTVDAEVVDEIPKANPDYGDWSAGVGTPFFYGGQAERGDVGDLRIDLALEVLAPGGAVVLEAGSDQHHAAWSISLGGEAPKLEETARRHLCAEAVTLAPGQPHMLSLAYVDGTVQASLDGRVLEPRKVDGVQPMGVRLMKSVAKVRFAAGSRVRIGRLDLLRDLFYTVPLDSTTGVDPINSASNADGKRRVEKGMYIAEIPKRNPFSQPGPDNRDFFMVLGDNSPSSADSRVWGFVPRENFVGRGSLTWWPPSRWRNLH